ncbi:YafY family protein [Bradyrhizobium liaoningense]|uniref:helix-turn-helix transcriptional regulator n=1 Tax=Bradyrhizobium liaoningense TaxID=43992 RepID=UPI001BA8DEFD|nr:WYL domain-containing protein [Bradyrhizobium liaoningense]MBR0820255.1 WYL domain-containing protein [Bradyrhizobium liaoningense]
MRYEKLEALLRVALDMRGSAEGISLDDIQRSYGISRRTAERMRDAIERVFPQMEQANPGEVPKRWRIRSGPIANLAGISSEELAALSTAAQIAKRDNIADLPARLETLAAKLKSLVRPEVARRIGPDLEALTEAEGIALRPGPRLTIPNALLEDLRHAILACRKIRLHYRARGTGKLSRQLVCPYGFLYGNRHYLVAYSPSEGISDYRLFALANIEKVEVQEAPFRRRKDFSLQGFAERSFGVFQEDPLDVVWRFTPQAAPDARQFLFHPSQIVEDEPDGSLVVRFRAGGALEMCWHLFTWGDQVEVVQPKRLRTLLGQEARKSAQNLPG